MGNVVYVIYIGGVGNELWVFRDFLFKVVDGEVYIVVEINFIDILVINGMSFIELFYVCLDVING